LVALNYVGIVATVMFVFRRFFGIATERSIFVIQLFVPSFVALTGDINGLLLFKTNIMILGFFFPIIFIYMLLRNFPKTNHSQKVGKVDCPTP
jgi:uncharacterized membrane protein